MMRIRELRSVYETISSRSVRHPLLARGKLPEAMPTWKVVLDLEPGTPNAKKNID